MGSPGTRLLPSGGTLTQGQWGRRHRVLLVVLAVHVPALTAFGLARGFGLLHLLPEVGVVVVLVLVGASSRARELVRAAAVGLGLTVCSALLVHLSGGAIEAHFHFFLIVNLIAYYEEWSVLGVTVAFVLLHHLVVGYVSPESVFSHPGGQADPLLWTAVHTVAIAVQCAFAVTQWRVHETALAADRALARQLLASETARREHQRREQVLGLAAGVAHGLNTPVQYSADNARFLGSVLAETTLVLAATEAELAVVRSGRLDPAQVQVVIAAVLERLRSHSEECSELERTRALSDLLEGLDEVARLVVGLRAVAEDPDGAAALDRAGVSVGAVVPVQRTAGGRAVV